MGKRTICVRATKHAGHKRDACGSFKSPCGSGVIQLQPIDYLDNYTKNTKTYLRQLNWQKIMNIK
ncbi:MAG: hypothetical protein JWQ63_3853 [Mucilaginibacter sp.]|nr:hypothetical protein [Mucilaginibacter sp.]